MQNVALYAKFTFAIVYNPRQLNYIVSYARATALNNVAVIGRSRHVSGLGLRLGLKLGFVQVLELAIRLGLVRFRISVSIRVRVRVWFMEAISHNLIPKPKPNPYPNLNLNPNLNRNPSTLLLHSVTVMLFHAVALAYETM